MGNIYRIFFDIIVIFWPFSTGSIVLIILGIIFLRKNKHTQNVRMNWKRIIALTLLVTGLFIFVCLLFASYAILRINFSSSIFT